MDRMCSAFVVTFTALHYCINSPLLAEEAPAAKPRMNVLFVAVDDLRPELGCYGHPQIKSPNIDALAKQGLRFDRAYCQYALCNPSRSSLLTGRRPDSIRIYDLATFVRTHEPDVVTLPQLFKQNGYESCSIGKIFHVTNGNHEDEASWSTPAWQSPKDDNPETRLAAQKARAKAEAVKSKQRSPDGEDPHADDLPYESPDVTDNKLIDGQIADKAVSTLNELKDRPFFLAVGFHKPHMPWVAPKTYWDLYDPSTLRLAEFQDLPSGAPTYASNDASEFRRYMNVPKEGPLPEGLQRSAIHGYFACVSFVDAQVGRVINELDRLGLRKSTVVILWGDHGYQLGEHGTWNKRTNWEVAARVPLIISAPGQQHAGSQTSALVELLDMYPTLVHLCGLKPPAELEGRSFVPLLRKPDLPWKQAAFTMVTRRIPEMGNGFGRSLRTDRYRFVEWTGPKSDKHVYELYDEVADPLEKVNIADRPENDQLVAELTKRLHDNGK